MERPVAGVIQPGFKSRLCHALAACDLGHTAQLWKLPCHLKNGDKNSHLQGCEN